MNQLLHDLNAAYLAAAQSATSLHSKDEPALLASIAPRPPKRPLGDAPYVWPQAQDSPKRAPRPDSDQPSLNMTFA